ncbi:aspartyl protease family protein [uncultured Draconibacterium sp.]|uniref:aspartyl protease family protein n=1 Tax=uncultured Draconibacterium sp. TaxID=1573823 RepID=UPI0025EEABC1|nr:aspartyl protease family protein [uncultured Draconibacterium sp.]
MRTKIPIDIIELESSNYHLILPTQFEGRENAYWVIDTGASKSVFDQNLADFIAHTEEGTEDLHAANMSEEPLKTSLGILKPLFFGKLKVDNMKVALMDMNHINELYQKVTDYKICGLLGSDFLLNYNAVIDYKRRVLKLSDQKTGF